MRTMLGAMIGLCLTTPAWAGEISLGSHAPDFQLADVVSGRVVSRDELAGKRALLVVVLCRHCPYVQHVKDGLAQLARDYAQADLAIVGISANDPAAYPNDAPPRLKAMAQEAGWTFPVLFDETQAVARSFGAAFTPDFYLFDAEQRLVYHGQFDASRPRNGLPVTGADVRAAIDAVLAGRPVPADQQPGFGCSIKWKPGNPPADYHYPGGRLGTTSSRRFPPQSYIISFKVLFVTACWKMGSYITLVWLLTEISLYYILSVDGETR